MKKLVVFLRHNNDIDHITPVLYKWLKTGDIPVQIYLSDKSYLGDNRLRFLSDNSRNVCVDVWNKKNGLDDAGVVVFDWVMNDFVKHVKGVVDVPLVSLPHGDSPYVNRLETRDALCYDDVDNSLDFDLFDYVVVPNWLCERRYKGIIGNGKIKTFGSARYCDEWMGVHDSSIPCDVFSPGMGKKLLVMYTRNVEYPIFWEEVARVIRMVLSFDDDVVLVVKRHSRSTGGRVVEHRIVGCDPGLKKMGNLFFMVADGSLLGGCMGVLDMGSSMSWEAVKKGIPVLCLDLVHCNRSTVGHYIDGCRVDTRDRLLHGLGMVLDGVGSVYNDGQRRCFINEVIDVPDKDVLERYCVFLEGLF